MVPAVKPVIELVKVPVPEPFTVLVVNATVGLVVIPQTTPRAVTLAPPSGVTLPPLLAVVPVTEDTTVVLIIGTVTGG